MSRRIARTDANHREVLDTVTAIGAEVLDLHSLGGALDALVGFRGRLYLVEIKDGRKQPSKRRLTAAERATIERFQRIGCPVIVAESADDLLRAIGALA